MRGVRGGSPICPWSSLPDSRRRLQWLPSCCPPCGIFCMMTLCVCGRSSILSKRCSSKRSSTLTTVPARHDCRMIAAPLLRECCTIGVCQAAVVCECVHTRLSPASRQHLAPISRANISCPHLARISPVSRPHLARISPASRSHLARILLASRSHLARISLASRPSLARISLTSRSHLAHISLTCRETHWIRQDDRAAAHARRSLERCR